MGIATNCLFPDVLNFLLFSISAALLTQLSAVTNNKKDAFPLGKRPFFILQTLRQ